MKNVSKFLVGAFILSIFFAACKKDDNTPDNQMKYDDIEYDLSQGFLENYGLSGNNTGYNFVLVLMSSGFTVHEDGGEIDSLSGIGHGIYFDLFNSNPDRLAVGDYNFDSNDTGNAGTFNYADGVVNFNSQTGEGDEFEIEGGKLTVVQNGDVYELTFDCTADAGKHITGYFKGALKYYDLTDGLKSSKREFKDNIFR